MIAKTMKTSVICVVKMNLEAISNWKEMDVMTCATVKHLRRRLKRRKKKKVVPPGLDDKKKSKKKGPRSNKRTRRRKKKSKVVGGWIWRPRAKPLVQISPK